MNTGPQARITALDRDEPYRGTYAYDQAALALDFATPAQLEQWLRPEAMLGPVTDTGGQQAKP